MQESLATNEGLARQNESMAPEFSRETMNNHLLRCSREILRLALNLTLKLKLKSLLQFLLGPFIQFAVFDASCHRTPHIFYCDFNFLFLYHRCDCLEASSLETFIHFHANPSTGRSRNAFIWRQLFAYFEVAIFMKFVLWGIF